MGIASSVKSSGITPGRGFRPQPLLVTTSVIVALGVRFFFFIWQYSVNVFFYDQWDYLDSFFHGKPGFGELFFHQHGPHREGVGLIVDKFLYPLTRWNVRAESFMIGGFILAAMLLALLLKHKLFGPWSYSDVAIPLMFLSMAQYETVIGTPNPAYSSLPLLLMMLYCLALLQRDWLPRYGLLLMLNFLMIYTGFGLFMGAVTVGVFALESYWSLRRMTSVPFAIPSAGLLVAAVSLGSFFVHYTFSPAVDCFEVPRHHLMSYPWFIALMFAAFVAPKPFFLPLTTVLGVLILLAVAAILTVHILRLVKRDSSADAHLIGAVLLSYCLLFSTNTAIGRTCLGIPAAPFSSRYTTLLIPAYLAIYFFGLSLAWQGKRNLVLGLFVLLLVPGALLQHRGTVHWLSDGKRTWANCYLQTESIQHCDQVTHFTVYPYPERNGLQQKLDFLKQHRLNLFADQGTK